MVKMPQTPVGGMLAAAAACETILKKINFGVILVETIFFKFYFILLQCCGASHHDARSMHAGTTAARSAFPIGKLLLPSSSFCWQWCP
jgi:hypothetical protein